LIGSLGATSISIGIFLYLSHYEMSGESQLGNNGPGNIISSVHSIRLAIFLITTALIAACAVFNVIDFSPALDEPMLVDVAFEVDDDNSTLVNATTTTTDLPSTPNTEYVTEIPFYYLFLCGLSLSAISAFLRVGFILKLFLMVLVVILQTIILYTSRLFEEYESTRDGL
jgi:adenylate cyclase 2